MDIVKSQYIEQNKKIKKFLKHEHKNKAIKYLKNFIHKHKSVCLNSLILAEIYCQQNDYQNAIKVLDIALSPIYELNTDEKVTINNQLAILYTDKGNLQRAYQCYNNILKINKSDSKTIASIGLLLLDIGKLDFARKYVEYLIKNDRDNKEYQILLAYYFIRNLEFEKAEKILKSILANNEDNYDAHYYLGFMYYMYNEYEKAVSYFEKAKIDRKYRFKCYYFSGKSCVKKSNHQHAIEYFIQAEKLIHTENHQTMDLRYQLALCYEHFQQTEKALIQLRIIHKINPQYKDIAEKLISENYQIASQNLLLEYETYSKQEYLKFAHTLLLQKKWEPVKEHFYYENNVLVVECNEFSNEIKGKQRELMHKKKKFLGIFFRCMPLKENILQDFLENTHFNYKKGIIATSSQISPLAVEYAQKHNFQVIIPSYLNKLLKKGVESPSNENEGKM